MCGAPARGGGVGGRQGGRHPRQCHLSRRLPAGQSQVQFTFDALSDALTEGVETIKISFQLTDPCGNVTPIELNFSINDVQPVSVTIQNATVVCPGDPVQLLAIPSGGTGPYTFNWSTSFE